MQNAISRAGILLSLLWLILVPTLGNAAKLDELSLDRWKQLREVERYQLKICEEYYRDKKWKIAADEYEKFLTLYETSEAAPYSLLKWGLCQLQLRKQNTAISEGFQSVIDYWPESVEATSSAYFIGQTYKNIGEPKKAKQAYAAVLKNHPKHLVAVYALHDLIDISKVEGDLDGRVELWKRLTFDTPRTKDSSNFCVKASQELASYYFHEAAFNDGVKALETSYTDADLPNRVFEYTKSAATTLHKDPKKQTEAEKLVDDGIQWLKRETPTDLADDELKQAAKKRWFAIVDLNRAIERDQEIVDLYKQMQDRFGKDDEILDHLAGWQKSQDKFDAARQTYNQFEDQIKGQSRIAESYYQQREYAKAANAYQQVLALDPENPLKWKPAIASNYRRASKPDPAIAVYRELIVDDANNPTRWQMEIGRTLRDAARYDDAIRQYQSTSDFPQNVIEIADCYRRQKKWKSAIQSYAQVVGSAENQNRAAWALLQIGDCYEKSGNKEAAIRAFQQVCKKYPKDGYASQAHARLQKDYGITVTFGGGKDE
ncbi:tetratricopeptide repeat protein [Thalassoroseus pseudoceratinae]|uniref:tetratricopeptide repeat protein n=1 Tax=Thalassoroseus pseudoceratinae TaxID=2713176 RepID=UPI0014224D91|nr:tetratricopeptide repeat protein [Thalassoroseus pseudoceratinae]